VEKVTVTVVGYLVIGTLVIPRGSKVELRPDQAERLEKAGIVKGVELPKLIVPEYSTGKGAKRKYRKRKDN